MIYLLHCCNSSLEEVGATHVEEDIAVRDVRLLSLHVEVTDTRACDTSDSARELQCGITEDKSMIGP